MRTRQPITGATRKLSRTFQRFFESEKSSGVLLVICTVTSLAIANSVVGNRYLGFWHTHLAGLSVEQWVNDVLMAVFFLLIGLELKRELVNGELSDFKNALLPIFAAIGGICAPALIHFAFNAGAPTQRGVGIPMATDIAFALAALSLLGPRIPSSLKIFLTALAVMDDLGAIIVIAVFYSTSISIAYLLGAIAILIALLGLNRIVGVKSLLPYLLGGVVMWILMFKSGVHATIAGVMLAFAIPFSAKEDDEQSASHRLEHFLHTPVAFIILPIFALANTGLLLMLNPKQTLMNANSLGIIAGLVIGKPIGITLISYCVIAIGICQLPSDLNWRHIFGAGILGGIGFTMSIFITNLAFSGNPETINSSKIAILFASLIAGTLGYLWLRFIEKGAD